MINRSTFAGTCVLCCLFQNTHSQNVFYDPKTVYQFFWKQKNQDMLNGKQQDAQEFWIRLMQLIDCGMNSCTKYSKWFEHKIKICVNCGNCNTESITKENFSAHVIEIRGKQTLQEAVNAYFAEQSVESYKCGNCKTFGQAKKNYFLEESPNCLCLLLSRFENINTKIDQSIVINEQLKLSRYNSNNEANEINYKLASVINHIGKNLIQGHYTAISWNGRNFVYEFDDINVRRINAVSGSDAYMLIYELTTKVFLSCEV